MDAGTAEQTTKTRENGTRIRPALPHFLRPLHQIYQKYQMARLSPHCPDHPHILTSDLQNHRSKISINPSFLQNSRINHQRK